MNNNNTEIHSKELKAILNRFPMWITVGHFITIFIFIVIVIKGISLFDYPKQEQHITRIDSIYYSDKSNKLMLRLIILDKKEHKIENNQNILIIFENIQQKQKDSIMGTIESKTENKIECKIDISLNSTPTLLNLKTNDNGNDILEINTFSKQNFLFDYLEKQMRFLKQE